MRLNTEGKKLASMFNTGELHYTMSTDEYRNVLEKNDIRYIEISNTNENGKEIRILLVESQINNRLLQRVLNTMGGKNGKKKQ